MAVPLDDGALCYLIARTVHDLDVRDQMEDVPRSVLPFFETKRVADLSVSSLDFTTAADRLFTSVLDSDTYFSCLAALLKARLKFERILQHQPFPTLDQIGPRGLLQYGSLSPSGLAALLIWRKWLYDTDNRAAQETGYLFEPILAAAIGGAPASAARSPIRRGNDAGRGRQVDCIKGRTVYEFKLRVTTAASGQGRWGEELSFPEDCHNSDYVPVLIVLDATENTKLSELTAAFEGAGGTAYVGDAAWRMLEGEAGPIMATFLERYVRRPLHSILEHGGDHLPNLEIAYRAGLLEIKVGGESLTIQRSPGGDFEIE